MNVVNTFDIFSYTPKRFFNSSFVVAERYTPGVGKTRREDLVKREVIHLLCKGPSTFSELEKRLSEDPNEKTGLESVIRDVATFR